MTIRERIEKQKSKSDERLRRYFSPPAGEPQYCRNRVFCLPALLQRNRVFF